jgi:hypothetical protein
MGEIYPGKHRYLNFFTSISKPIKEYRLDVKGRLRVLASTYFDQSNGSSMKKNELASGLLMS